jgi:hypothetical protein
MREGEEEGRMGVGRGARAGPGWTRPGRAGPDRPGWAGSGHIADQNQTGLDRDTHDHQTELNREPKSETERDEHATSDKETCFGMMQHP